jgi:phage host-nuclease inhibitor protein Gam
MHYIFIPYLFTIYHVQNQIVKHRSPFKVYHTRLRSRMENEKKAHLKSHYQNELEFIKNEVARMINCLSNF